MYITYLSRWLYTVMQLPVPIVLSPNHVYSISIFNLFIGVLLFGIFMIIIERAFNGLRFSDYRNKEEVKTTDVIEKSHASNDLNGYDSLGRKRFSTYSKSSMGQRIIENKEKKERGDE